MRLKIIGLLLVTIQVFDGLNAITVSPIKSVNRVGRFYDSSTSEPMVYLPPFNNALRNRNRESDNVKTRSRNIGGNSRDSISGIRGIVHQEQPSSSSSARGSSRNYNVNQNQPFQLDLRQQNYKQQQNYYRNNRIAFDFDQQASSLREVVSTPNPRISYRMPDLPSVTPTFSTVRNAVKRLRSRHREMFRSEMDERPASNHQKTNETTVPLLGVEIFQESKKIVEKKVKKIPQEPTQVASQRNDKSASSEESNKSKQFSFRELPKMLHKAHRFNNSPYGFVDQTDGISEAETKSDPNFVPIQRYTQVRKSETVGVAPRPKNEPRAKERIKTEKSHTIYSEDGYEDSEFDHGDEERFGNTSEESKKRKKREVEKIVDEIEDEDDIEEIEELPISLALTQTKTKLSGEDLIKHISELLKNTTQYLPDESDESGDEPVVLSQKEVQKLFKNRQKKRTIRPHRKDETFRPSPVDNFASASTKTYSSGRKKYPYYNLPPQILHEMSAFRYAESIKRYPNNNISPYQKAKTDIYNCDESDPSLDKVASKGGHRFKNHAPKPRLGKLGDRINCLRVKYFGQHPLDNPIFKEKFASAPGYYENPNRKTTVLPWTATNRLQTLPPQLNPSINVYDDIVSNIRASLNREQELKKKQVDTQITKWKYIAPSKIGLKTTKDNVDPALQDDDVEVSETQNLEINSEGDMFIAVVKKKRKVPHTSYQPTNDNQFDINQYLPKIYMVKPNGKIYSIKYKTRKQPTPKIRLKEGKTTQTTQQQQDYTVFPQPEGIVDQNTEPSRVRQVTHRPPSRYSPFPTRRKKFHYETIKLV